MAKIENAPEKVPARHLFEVLISFDGLDVGERFPQAPDEWTRHGAAMGYLKDLGEEAADARSGAEGQS
jgi:hypothetical protein